MIERIDVVDNILPHVHFFAMTQELSRLVMSYGPKSNSKTDPYGHWSTKFVDGGKYNLADISFDIQQNPALPWLYGAWERIQKEYLNGAILLRCYVNAYTYGTEGYTHSDSTRDGETTIVLFMNDSWEVDWAGETIFVDNNQEIVRAVIPKPNRALIFDSALRHAARGVSRKCSALRRVLVFKARRRRSATFERLSKFLVTAGARQHAHKRGSLHDHLVRTYEILEHRGVRDAVCLAGGLHAVYGTARFKQSIISSAARDTVAAEFGAEAESLAFTFGKLDRPATLNSPILLDNGQYGLRKTNGSELRVSEGILSDLRLIESANLADQKVLSRYPARLKFWEDANANVTNSSTG